MSDACLGPNAVMIKLVNTLTTATTMRDSWQLEVIALITVSGCQKIFRVNELCANCIVAHKLGHFWDFIADTMCLNVAPQNHAYVKPCYVVEYP